MLTINILFLLQLEINVMRPVVLKMFRKRTEAVYSVECLNLVILLLIASR